MAGSRSSARRSKGSETGMNYYQQQLQLVRQQAYPPGEICRRLAAARRFMDEHYAEPIRLDQVARSAWCSRFYFLRLFKQLYGCTPHQYLTGVRLARARTLLKAGSQAPEICRAVGFESTSSFKSLFKKHLGRTPAAWQRHQQKPVASPEPSLRFFPGAVPAKK